MLVFKDMYLCPVTEISAIIYMDKQKGVIYLLFYPEKFQNIYGMIQKFFTTTIYSLRVSMHVPALQDLPVFLPYTGLMVSNSIIGDRSFVLPSTLYEKLHPCGPLSVGQRL
jgi:hypothetical protein